MPRSPPPRSSGSAVAGIWAWLVVMVSGGGFRSRRLVRSFSGSGPSALLFITLFPHPVGLQFCSAFLCNRSSSGFSHPPALQSQSHREGKASWRSGDEASFGWSGPFAAWREICWAGPRSGVPQRVVGQLQRRDTSNHVDSIDRLDKGGSGCYTIGGYQGCRSYSDHCMIIGAVVTVILLVAIVAVVFVVASVAVIADSSLAQAFPRLACIPDQLRRSGVQ